MRRGAKPGKAKAGPKLLVARKSLKSADSRVRALEKRLAEALKREAEALKRESEALEQQTATSEILRVISSSPTDLQPVFDMIVRNAARVCEAFDAVVVLADGEEFIQRAHHGPIAAVLGARYPLRGTVIGRAVLEARVIQVENLAEASDYPAGRELARRVGYRTTLSVPLLREGAAIGAIGIRRTEVLPFSDTQITLLQAFADQAVIAIENVRLFNELQDKTRVASEAHAQVSEALARETATSEILRVIGSSLTDAQPVFESIARSGLTVCAALGCVVFVVDGDMLRVAATAGVRPERVERFRRDYPISLSADIDTAQAVRERRMVHLADIVNNPNATANDVEVARLAGYRTRLMVPMVRGDRALGLIAVTREDSAAFPDQLVELLRTFADQAVIAIENVRLFKELEARNRDLTEALEQQTATADVLRIIAESPTDLQPVLDAIAARAVRLCEASDAVIERLEGDRFYNAAHAGAQMKGLVGLPLPLTRQFPGGRAVLDRHRIIIDDMQLVAESEYPDTLELLKLNTVHSCAEIPLLSKGQPLGNLAVLRAEVRPFTDAEVALLETFADQAVIAIENVRLFQELQKKNLALTEAHVQVSEALEQQTATAEILRVISRSPTDVQPVFDAIVRSASQLCDGADCIAVRFDGELMHLMARHNPKPGTLESVAALFPRRPSRGGTATDRAILEGHMVHVPDVLEDPTYDQRRVRAAQLRSLLSVPLMRAGNVIGAISPSRAVPGLFSDRQVELLKTFADQAVIAIENVRLFTELRASNRELTTALDQQTATSDILRVISQSQTNVQPVFDAIVDSAVRLLGADLGSMTRVAGDQIELAALTSTDDAGNAALRALFPRWLHSEGPQAQAIRDRAPLNIADAHTDPRMPEAGRASARIRGSRSWVVVPLLRHDEAVGTISVSRREPGGFTDDEIALLKTFADQAVIAIENVRLFKELEARNSDLSEALEQQTATAEILRVISRSPTDVQPVFDAIVESAVRLCDARYGAVFNFDGDLVHLMAHHNFSETALEGFREQYPMRPTRAHISGRAILSGSVVQIPDVTLDPEYGSPHTVPQGFRSLLAVPILRGGAPIGAIVIYRPESGMLSDEQISLLQTFAAQAVIAIENVRLFKELQARTGELTQSVEKLTALGEVSRAVSSTLDVETVLDTIVSRASQLAGADGCSIFEYDEGAEQFQLRATHNDDAAFVAALRAVPLRKGEGLMGRAAEMREPIQIPDISQPGAYRSSVRDTLIRFGYRALLSVPLLREDQIIGSLSFNRKAPGEFPPEVVDVLKTFATQSALAIQNARLFREIADKSAQLEAASRHKSEFLANMSHELRTPLNAIIGFSEVLTERMFGELNEKQDEYLKDIYASGQHLLSLINDILDLSKIEAGRMELEAADFDLPSAIDNALILVRERATRRGITLGRTIDERLGTLRGDERKVKQVLLNLLSNALKFTPEGGRIDVSARLQDGAAEVAVTDTGVGIAPEDQEAVFEEFRQVGTADKKVEGTGLGLALSRKFIELHGGRIWVKSQVGHGSTFTFTLPVRRED